MIRAPLVLFALLWYAAVTGCTPVRTRIPPPYVVDGQQFNTVAALEEHASALCRQYADGAPMPPHKFTTDGCSAYPEGSAVRGCCIKHDVAYWCGATPRLDVDREFRRCLRDVSSAFNAAVMYVAVRFGGGRFAPFPWRFGYGHPWPHRRPEPSESGPQTPPTKP
jgi:hypothetical protein